MAISEKKISQLQEQMKSLGINEEDLEEAFILSSGRGGQKLQKSYSAVHLKHIPSGIAVKVSKSRFREENRFFARRELCEKIQEKVYKKKTDKGKLAEKKRKQKNRRKRRRKIQDASAEDTK